MEEYGLDESCFILHHMDGRLRCLPGEYMAPGPHHKHYSASLRSFFTGHSNRSQSPPPHSSGGCRSVVSRENVVLHLSACVHRHKEHRQTSRASSCTLKIPIKPSKPKHMKQETVATLPTPLTWYSFVVVLSCSQNIESSLTRSPHYSDNIPGKRRQKKKKL